MITIQRGYCMLYEYTVKENSMANRLAPFYCTRSRITRTGGDRPCRRAGCRTSSTAVVIAHSIMRNRDA